MTTSFIEFMAQNAKPVYTPPPPPPPPSMESLKETYLQAVATYEKGIEAFNAFNASRAAANKAYTLAQEAIEAAQADLQKEVSTGGDGTSALRDIRDARAAFEDAKALAVSLGKIVGPKDPSTRDVEGALMEIARRAVEIEQEAFPVEIVELMNRCYASLSLSVPAGGTSPTWAEWLERMIPQEKDLYPAYRAELLGKYGVEL